MSNSYSSSVCKQCLTTLNEHIKYKENMIANQRKLYSNVDCHNFVKIDIKEEPIEVHETFPDLDFVEKLAVKTENDEDQDDEHDDNHHEDLESELESQVETQPAEENSESTKVRNKNYKKYSEEQIQSAFNAVTSGQLTIYKAGKTFGIPQSTLSEKFKKGFFTKKLIKGAKGGKTEVVPLSAPSHALQHSLDVIDETLHVCDLCGFETLIKNNLTHHMTSHLEGHDITKVTCSLCQKVFLNKQIKMMHEKNHCQTSKGNFSCEKCGMNFTTKLLMIHHHNADHGNFACKRCDKVFLRKIDLFVHAKTHGKEGKELPCKVCRKKFVAGIAYETHLAGHVLTYDVKSGRYATTICKYCSKVVSKQSIRRHVSSLHSNKIIH